MESNPCKSTWDLATDLNTSQATICHQLKKKYKSEQGGHFISSYSQKEDHISIPMSLLSRQRNNQFLKNIITGYEKWFFLGQCSMQKAVDWQKWISRGRTSWTNVMLRVWWDHHSTIHFEFLNFRYSALCSSTIMQDHIHQESHRKKYWI